MPGVRYVVEVPNGVAVVATSFWAAKKGRDALKIEWDEATGIKFSSADILAEYRRLAATPGKVARNDGDAAKAMDGAAKKLEATYEFPYLAHAAMEPLDCVVRLDESELRSLERRAVPDRRPVGGRASVGLKPEQVKLNMLYAGGSFGRRANPAGDYVVEAARDRQGARRAGQARHPGQARVDARGRHEGRLLSAGLPATR